MTHRIVYAATGEPVDSQVGYVDGYFAAEQLLEGVLFKITIDPATGLPVCDGVHHQQQDYVAKFSAEQMQEWQEIALDAAADGMTDFSGEHELMFEVLE